MSRNDQLLEHFRTMAGPLGPFVSLDERVRQRVLWPLSLSREDARVIAEILYVPPKDWNESIEQEAVLALSLIGIRNKLWFYEFIRTIFEQRGPTCALIEALGAVAPFGASNLLIDLTTRTTLERTCMIAVVGALGELRDTQALNWLENYRIKLGPDGDPEFLQEVEVALKPAGSLQKVGN